VAVLFGLALAWNLSRGFTLTSFSVPLTITPDLVTEKLGATMLPPPWEEVRVALGPTMPPPPWEDIRIALGPTMPPSHREDVRVTLGPTMPPPPWEDAV
jgi:hypothetical protein